MSQRLLQFDVRISKFVLRDFKIENVKVSLSGNGVRDIRGLTGLQTHPLTILRSSTGVCRDRQRVCPQTCARITEYHVLSFRQGVSPRGTLSFDFFKIDQSTDFQKTILKIRRSELEINNHLKFDALNFAPHSTFPRSWSRPRKQSFHSTHFRTKSTSSYRFSILKMRWNDSPIYKQDSRHPRIVEDLDLVVRPAAHIFDDISRRTVVHVSKIPTRRIFHNS